MIVRGSRRQRLNLNRGNLALESLKIKDFSAFSLFGEIHMRFENQACSYIPHLGKNSRKFQAPSSLFSGRRNLFNSPANFLSVSG